MKFLDIINKQYLITLTLLFVIISFAGYFILSLVIENELKEDIKEQEYAIIREITNSGNLPNIYPNIETKKIPKTSAAKKFFKQIYLLDSLEDETEPYIEYSNTVEINGQFYLITLRHSDLEKYDLIIAIAIPFLVLLVLGFIISFLTNKRLNKSVWKDFEHNLSQIEKFSLSKKQDILLNETDIEEFTRLNKVISSMSSNLQKEYSSLQEFTENASHEIQTPLAVALLNLEEMLQADLPEHQLKYIVNSINSLKRLSTLNQSLILITKLENGQYPTDKQLNITNVLKQKINDLEALFELRKIKINIDVLDDFVHEIHPHLAEILIGNLLSNAMKHNIEKGQIDIKISEKYFEICNTGQDIPLDRDKIFLRFTKNNSESFGLGLAIVKKICDTNNLEVEYKKDNLHCFIIKPKNLA